MRDPRRGPCFAKKIIEAGRSKFGLHTAKTIIHANQHLVDVREFERGRGGIPIFKLRAPIRSKAIFDACSECPADPFIGARTFKFARGRPPITPSEPQVNPLSVLKFVLAPRTAKPTVA